MARGQSEKILWELLVLVLIAIVAVAILIAIDRALGGASANESQASEYSFLSLASVIRTFASDPSPYKITGWAEDKRPMANVPVYLQDAYSIVGFGKADTSAFGSCKKGGGIANIPKPSVCGKKACLCFYKSGHIQASEISGTPVPDVKAPVPEPLQCVTFNDVDFILTPEYALAGDDKLLLGQPYPRSAIDGRIRGTYASLILYGTCANKKGSFGTQALSVEKFTASEKTYIVIDYPQSKEIIDARKRNLESIAQNTLKSLGDKAFTEGRYGDAVSSYEKALEGQSLQPATRQEIVMTLAEAAYRLAQIPGVTQPENKTKAATHALAAMTDDWGDVTPQTLLKYMKNLQTYLPGHAIITLTPLPEAIPQEGWFESPVLLSQIEPAYARFKLLAEGKPEDEVLAYLAAKSAFELHQVKNTIPDAIPELERALALAGTRVPKQIIWYDLGLAYYYKAVASSGSESELAKQKMLEAYANAAAEPVPTELVELHNRAQTTLASVCALFKNTGSFCSVSGGTAPIEGGACTDSSRCATLTQDQLNAFSEDTFKDWPRFTCVNNKWVADTACSKYCIDRVGATFTAECTDE